MVRLHGYFRSSSAFRVRIALNLKGVPYESIAYHLRREEQHSKAMRVLNPQEMVPALEIDGRVLTQSMGIVEYLDETRPDPALLPADAAGRARVRALAQVVGCDIHPIDNLRVLKYLREEFGQPEPAVAAWFNHWASIGFDALEALLTARAGTGEFCHGDSPGLADICLVPQVVNGVRFGLDLSPWPTVRRIHANCLAVPAFERALPANQPDAEA
jgi:maleylacetoacetate isomerase